LLGRRRADCGKTKKPIKYEKEGVLAPLIAEIKTKSIKIQVAKTYKFNEKRIHKTIIHSKYK